jgi:hypothetical protein
MAKVRIREPLSIYDHDNDVFISPSLDQYFDDTDPFVKANAWAFATDEELAEAAAQPHALEVGLVEDATNQPGKARRTRHK